MTTGPNVLWPKRKVVAGVGGSGFDISGQFSGRFDFSHWTRLCIRTRVCGVSHRSHKKSDADFRKELINADMGVFNKITKRQTPARKYKADKNVTSLSRARPR